MQREEKQNTERSREDEAEKIRSNPSLVEECKLTRESEPRYETEIENVDERYDVFQEFMPTAFFFFHRERRPRRWFIRLVTWPYFERLSILVILVNCVTLGLYDPFDPECQTQRCQTLDAMEKVIYTFFLVEMLCKWMAMGLFGKLAYFGDAWNRLDCFIVAAGTFELLYNKGEYLSAVRAIRVLRPLRAINRVPSIRILVTLLLDTLPMLWNVLAICFFIFAIFGIVAVQLWRGALRGRCFLDLPQGVTEDSYNLTDFYIPSFDNPDFVCAVNGVPGMQTCISEFIPALKNENRECTLTYEGYINQSRRSNNSNNCINWNQYYTVCRKEGDNPSWGAIGFDNIFIAWVAIFQVITLEGWTDIMYYVQDAHGFWNWIYFVILIVIASYFMTNLCLVVITTQFQETKQRENELLRESRRREGTSTSTIASSRYGKDGCWVEILRYVEHLIRRFKRRLYRRFNWKYCDSGSKRKKGSKHRKRRRRKKKLVYHHHHHHHHHHHYHHHVHCTDPDCPCSKVAPQFPVHPGSADVTPNTSTVDIQPIQSKHFQPSANTLTVPGQVPGNGTSGRENDNGKGTIPTISIITGSSCSVRKEPSSSTHGGEMITTATAAVAINGKSAVADMATHTFLSAASLSSAAATATASAAAASVIHNVCSCAVEHVEEDIKVDYESECVYEEDGGSESEFTDDEVDEEEDGKDTACSRLRQVCRRSVDSKWFMYIIMAAIFLNTLSMGIEYHGQPSKMTEVLEILNYIFTAIFGIEMVLKLIGMGPYGYIKDPFNIFDGFIVIMSIVELFGDGNSSISVLRSFRLLRIFKLVRFLPALRRQLLVMIHTMDNVMTFLALLILFIFTASILGMNLFGGKYMFPDEDGEKSAARANFDDLFWALVTVFQVLTQEDWNTVMYDGMRATSKWAALYFILLMTIGNYILFNLLVAILVEGFANQPEKTGSTWSVKSRASSSRNNGDYDTCKELVSYPVNTPRVCVSRIPSHEDTSHGNYNEPDKPVQHMRCSFPSLSPKCSLFRDECHASAPTSPASTSPHVARKTLSFGDTTTMVIANPAHAERCITSDDENEASAKEDDESVVANEGVSRCCPRRRNWSLYLFSPSNRFRQWNIALYKNKWFDRVILFFILLNCVVMALEKPSLKSDDKLKKAIDICMYIFLGIFTLEMMVKVIALGFCIGPDTYMRNSWNVMDGFLVLVSWIDVIVSQTTKTESSILGVLRVFRALRTLRPLRVISRAPGLKIVVETLISSLKPIGNIVLIAATFFIIFGILGVQLFKGKFYHCKDSDYPTVVTKDDCQQLGLTWENKEYNFDNLARALLTLFVFSTKDGWVTIMYDGIDAEGVDKQPIPNRNKWNVLYFVAFLLLAGFVVLNMLVGVVVENFQKCRDMIEKDRLAEKEKKRVEKLQSEADRDEADDFPQPRRFFHRICTHGYFDLGISAVIFLNVICMAMEHYNQPEEMTLFLRYANYVFTAIFIVEGVVKIYALGFKKYIKERWNQLDLLIILLSIVGIVLEEMKSKLPINPTIIRVMRVLRIARVLKLLKTAEGIRKLLDTVAEALPQVGNLGLLFLLMFFIFAALGMELFGQVACTDEVPCEGLDHHAHFKDFGFSMLTLFRVSTGDNWNGILKDIINKKRCELNPTPGCAALEHIAPIYFAIFVLATQFVLLNVVVAVLMKHLEDAKEESPTASKEGSDDVSAMQVDGVSDPKHIQGESSIDHEYRMVPSSTKGKTESNNNPMVVVPVVGFVRQSNGSDSSLSSFGHVQPEGGSSHWLPAIDQTKPEHNKSLASIRLPPIGKNSDKIEDSSLSELSSPENDKPSKMLDGQMSPRAPIYVMSEDSDLYDSNMEVDHDHSKVFKPVERSAKSKGSVRSPSSQSSSEDEGKNNKSQFRKPHHKSESPRGKTRKKQPKTSIVSPKPESKPAKPDARWASPVLNVEKGTEIIKLDSPKKDENQGTDYQMQSYV